MSFNFRTPCGGNIRAECSHHPSDLFCWGEISASDIREADLQPRRRNPRQRPHGLLCVLSSAPQSSGLLAADMWQKRVCRSAAWWDARCSDINWHQNGRLLSNRRAGKTMESRWKPTRLVSAVIAILHSLHHSSMFQHPSLLGLLLLLLLLLAPK